MTDNAAFEGVNPVLKELYDQIQSQVQALRDQFDTNQLDDDGRKKGREALWELRDKLESAEEADEQSEMMGYDALYAMSCAFDDMDLYAGIELEPLPDVVKGEGMRGAPSLLAGDTLWERLADFVEKHVPWREVTVAMSDVMDMEVAGEEPEDENEQAFMEAALAMARDYLVHDWRWHEGKGVLGRFRELTPNLTDEEKAATEVMERSHYDLYKVEDIDRDRGKVTLERVTDSEEVSVEVFEDVLEVLNPGDGLLARIYVWADGAELGAFLPLDGPTLDSLREDMDELIETDMEPPITPNRATKLKVFGHLIVSDLLFPEEDDFDDEDDEDLELDEEE